MAVKLTVTEVNNANFQKLRAENERLLAEKEALRVSLNLLVKWPTSPDMLAQAKRTLGEQGKR
jgi:hypothetical protein